MAKILAIVLPTIQLIMLGIQIALTVRSYRISRETDKLHDAAEKLLGEITVLRRSYESKEEQLH